MPSCPAVLLPVFRGAVPSWQMCCLSDYVHSKAVYRAKLLCCRPAVEQCIKLGNQRAANRVRQEFKLSERRWAWIKVRVLLFLQMCDSWQ